MNDNNHIYAPVSVDDVKSVLGENSNDVATLCMSERINSYSLIRPIPMDVPWIEVSEMKTLQTGDLQGAGWSRKQWGYQVPFVRNIADLDTIKDTPWFRPKPTAKDYKSLNHFDGYIHNVEPLFFWNIGGVETGELVSDEEIIIMLGFGIPQTDILSPSGRGNNGGVVSALEVFGGEEFYYGVKVDYDMWYQGFYGDSAVTPDSAPSGVIRTGMKAVAGRTYRFTPFISNKPANASGAEIYNLKFAPNYESTKVVVCTERVVGVGMRGMEWSDSTDLQLGYITKLAIVITNQYDHAFELRNFTLNVTEHGQGEGAIGGSSPYPLNYSVRLTEYIRVEARSTVVYEWDLGQSLRWRYPLTTTYAMVSCSGSLYSVYGDGKEVQPYWLEMRNPNVRQ